MKIQAYMNKDTKAVIATPYYEAMVNAGRIDVSEDKWMPLYELSFEEVNNIRDRE